MDPLVQLIGVSKSFGGATALHPTDLAFQSGLTTALIGPSGCGKSTLLRLIIALLQPDSGRIIFDGKELAAADVQKMRRRVGYVIQEGGLFPHLTAHANVLLMSRHLGRAGPEMHERLTELCALSQFPTNALDRYPAELSGGQRQRVSLMRALMLSPEVLLLDEPLGALDPLVRSALQRDLKTIFARLKQTAILVTHDMGEAAYLANEIVLMNEGRIVQRGSVADLRDHPTNSHRLRGIDQIPCAINPQAISRREIRRREIGELVNDHIGLRLGHGCDQRVPVEDVDHNRANPDRLHLSGLPGIPGGAEDLVPRPDQHRQELPADRARRAGHENGSVRVGTLAHGCNSLEMDDRKFDDQANLPEGLYVLRLGPLQKGHDPS